LFASAEHRGGDRSAVIGVDTSHHAVAVQHRKSRDLAAGAAQQLAAGTHRVKRRRPAALRESRRGGQQQRGDRQQGPEFSEVVDASVRSFIVATISS